MGRYTTLIMSMFPKSANKYNVIKMRIKSLQGKVSTKINYEIYENLKQWGQHCLPDSWSILKVGFPFPERRPFEDAHIWHLYMLKIDNYVYS